MAHIVRVACNWSFTSLYTSHHSSSLLGLRHFSNQAASTARPLSICIVGSGPAGFYTADKLLKKYGDHARIDILERLFTPFGLVRSGVAPDHQDTKNVTNHFTAIGKDPRCTFFGNVTLGTDVSLEELRSLYHAVVLAYGAESDRRLNIPGEDSLGVFSAREFVWWYNGHPDAAHLPVDLSHVESVAICGIGNVALDCSRVLLQPPPRLASTDIASHALRALQSSGVRHVHLVARRGPVQAACTPKELKELLTDFGLGVHAEPHQLAVSEQDAAEMRAARPKRRVYELMSKAVANYNASAAKHLHFQFYRNPVEILSDPTSGAAVGLRTEKTILRNDPTKGILAVGTGQLVDVPAQLILKSIGYKSLPVEGLPFDSYKGIVPNNAGRVVSSPASKDVVPGLYVSGWLKRGPTGIIGTNLVDAEETSECIVHDLGQLPTAHGNGCASVAGTAGLRALLQERGVHHVGFGDWLQLDEQERQAGQELGKLREKLVDMNAMQSIVNKKGPSI